MTPTEILKHLKTWEAHRLEKAEAFRDDDDEPAAQRELAFAEIIGHVMSLIDKHRWKPIAEYQGQELCVFRMDSGATCLLSNTEARGFFQDYQWFFEVPSPSPVHPAMVQDGRNGFTVDYRKKTYDGSYSDKGYCAISFSRTTNNEPILTIAPADHPQHPEFKWSVSTVDDTYIFKEIEHARRFLKGSEAAYSRREASKQEARFRKSIGMTTQRGTHGG